MRGGCGRAIDTSPNQRTTENGRTNNSTRRLYRIWTADNGNASVAEKETHDQKAPSEKETGKAWCQSERDTEKVTRKKACGAKKACTSCQRKSRRQSAHG
jgi:hypothetical protein